MDELEINDFGAEPQKLVDNCQRNKERLLALKQKLVLMREEKRSAPTGNYEEERNFRRLVNGFKKELRTLTNEIDHYQKLAEISVKNQKLQMQKRELKKQNRELEEMIRKLALGNFYRAIFFK